MGNIISSSAQSYRISGKTLTELRTSNALLPLSYPIFTKVIPTFKMKNNLPYHTIQEQNLKSYHGKAPEAFFCKLEYRLQKKAGFPIRFRLGEVNYQMRMEGKGF